MVFPHNGVSYHSENKHSPTLCNHRAECRVKEARHKTTRVCVFIYIRLGSKRHPGMAGAVTPGAFLGGEGGRRGGRQREGAELLRSVSPSRLHRGRKFVKWVKLLTFAIPGLFCRYNATSQQNSRAVCITMVNRKSNVGKCLDFCKAALRLVTSG